MKRTSTPGAFHNYPDRGLVGAASAPSLCATMKRTVALLAAGLPFLALAQSPITVTTGPGYSQQTWYQLSTDAVTGAPLAEWDLAFEINGGFTASILANTQKGLAVYQAPYAVAEWDVADTNGLAVSWTALHNSDTDWSTGALNRDANLDLFNLGWGIYDMVTHVVGGDSIYVVHLSSGAWKKLRIDALTGGTYHFTYADLDGTNEQMHALDKNDYMGKNFAYWSLEADAAIDREPASADWDLLFGKYMTDIGVWYGVTGALNNKGVRVVEVTGTPSTEAQMDWNGFHDDINTIGYDWKTFNNGTFQYEIADSLTYFVQDGLRGLSESGQRRRGADSDRRHGPGRLRGHPGPRRQAHAPAALGGADRSGREHHRCERPGRRGVRRALARRWCRTDGQTRDRIMTPAWLPAPGLTTALCARAPIRGVGRAGAGRHIPPHLRTAPGPPVPARSI